jgi:hypothetical protein
MRRRVQSDEELQRAERRLAEMAHDEALQGGFGSNLAQEGGEHHEHAAALAVELQAETTRLRDELYRLQVSALAGWR